MDGILLIQTFLAKALFYSKSRSSFYEDRQIKVDNKYGLITMNTRNIHSIEARATSDNSYYQIQDDSNTLIAMVEDMSSSDKIYQPTNYWAPYCESILNSLRQHGLHNIRRRDPKLFGTFGATDVAPRFQSPDCYSGDSSNYEVYLAVVGALNTIWEAGGPVGPDWTTLSDYFDMCRIVADANGTRSGVKVASSIGFSRYGNPLGFDDQGLFCSFNALYYYHFACFAARSVGLKEADTVVEIGSGYGGQAEVLKALFPDLTIVLLDLAPQLYVAERFLSATFPDAVIPYKNTRPSSWDGKLTPGHIHFLSPCDIERLAPTGRVLFWNSASFGEMEPETVINYGRNVSRFAHSLYLMQYFSGKPPNQAGAGGVLVSSDMAVYEAAFSDFQRTTTEKAVRANGLSILQEGNPPAPYLSTAWVRRDG